MRLEPMKGDNSPWGAIQDIEVLEDGVLFCSTASHGGVWLAPGKLAKMRPALLAPSDFYKAGSPWFEEDCEILRVVCAFPHLFKTPYAVAFESLCKWNPAVRDAVTKEAMAR